MKAEIDKVSIYAQESVVETLRGLKINWSGALKSIRVIREAKTEVVMEIDGVLVVTSVSLDDYPILNSVRNR